MKILEMVLNNIIHSAPDVPPETGGILGGRNQIISCYVFDNGSRLSNGYDTYAPDTKFLNHIIGKWQNEKIDFYGIFHTHFQKASNLSNGDKRYINQIMQSMPSQINSLYFPVVLPKDKMLVYRADRRNNQVFIINDGVEIYN